MLVISKNLRYQNIQKSLDHDNKTEANDREIIFRLIDCKIPVFLVQNTDQNMAKWQILVNKKAANHEDIFSTKQKN